MNFSERITIAANTTKANAVDTELKLIDGIITDVQIFLPEGHVGLSHLQIFDGEIQIFPTNLGADYSGTGANFKTKYIIVRPYALKLRTWNTDDTFSHDIIVRITLETRKPLSKAAIEIERQKGFLGAIIRVLNLLFGRKK